MSTEIKNTLFRFVTMRAPELSDEKDIQNRFLFRQEKPKEAKRNFDVSVETRAVNVSKWNAMKASATLFASAALQNEEQCKAINPKLYEFAIWLTRNRFSYTQEELLSQLNNSSAEIKPVIILSPEQIEILWDNVIYQVLTNKNFYVKEIIMQLLVANNLITKIVENDLQIIADLVNTKIVLPKSLFVEVDEIKKTGVRTKSVNNILELNKPTISSPSEQMVKLQSTTIAETIIKRQNNLKSELEKLDKSYKADYQLAYTIAQEEYQIKIKPILDQYSKDKEANDRDWYGKRDPKTPYDAANPYDKPPFFPLPDVPKFEFKFRNQVDLDNLHN